MICTNWQFMLSMMFAASALTYGLPKIKDWRTYWPAERAVLYGLTLAALILFLWSSL